MALLSFRQHIAIKLRFASAGDGRAATDFEEARKLQIKEVTWQRGQNPPLEDQPQSSHVTLAGHLTPLGLHLSH